MPDEKSELKIPNMLAPESASGVEVASEQDVETARGDVARHENSPPAMGESEGAVPESNVIAFPKREVAAAPKVERDPTVAAIDAILEEDLGKFVDDMSANDRTKFIAAGEELTSYIAKELAAKHPNYSHTLDAITKWLHRLPMLEKHYLRQAAKCKNDRVMLLAQRNEQQHALAA